MNQINIINQVTWTNIITIIIVVEIWSGYTVCYVDMKCIIILPYSIKTKENDIVNERKWNDIVKMVRSTTELCWQCVCVCVLIIPCNYSESSLLICLKIHGIIFSLKSVG